MDDTETNQENDDTFVIVCTVAALMYEFLLFLLICVIILIFLG